MPELDNIAGIPQHCQEVVDDLVKILDGHSIPPGYWLSGIADALLEAYCAGLTGAYRGGSDSRAGGLSPEDLGYVRSGILIIWEERKFPYGSAELDTSNLDPPN